MPRHVVRWIAATAIVAAAGVVVRFEASAPGDTPAPPTWRSGDDLAATPTEVDHPRVLGGAVGPARVLQFSPTSAHLLAVRDRGVDVWRTDGTRAGWLAVDGDRVRGATWSIDGTHVIVWSPDGAVRLWRPDPATLIRTVQAGMGAVDCAAPFPSDGIVTIGLDGVRRWWRPRGGAVRVDRGATVGPPCPPLGSGAIAVTSPDGAHRAFVDERGAVHLEPAP